MGSNMARTLIAADYPVVGRDIDPGAEARAREMGVEMVDSPAEVSRRADIVLLSLPLPSDVDAVVVGPDGILSVPKAGGVIVDLSTVDPFTTQRNAAKAAEKGMAYLDAPVLGRPPKCGNWTLPVGGPEETLEKWRSVLEVLAKKVIRVGPSGHGNIVKILNNMMFGAINAVTAEIMALSAKFGLSPAILFNTICDSGAASVSGLFKELGPKMLSRDFSPLFSINLLHKDMQLGIDMARKAGAPLFVGAANQLLNDLARSRGLGAEDTSAVVKVYEEILNVTVC